MSLRSLDAWQRLGGETGEPLFHPTGVLWLGARGRPATRRTRSRRWRASAFGTKRLGANEIRARYPQFVLDDDVWGIFEPESGALMARRAVQAVVREAVRAGVEYRTAAVAPPEPRGRLPALRTGDGADISAGTFVFACGPWLPQVFPDLLGARIFPTRQEVFFFGPPPGDERFAPPRMPTWIDFGAEIYGLPDLEARGFKLAPDRHGGPIDPDARRTARCRRQRRARPRLPRPPLPGARGGAAPGDARLPVREHVERRLPDRPPSRRRQRLARRRRLGARVQARTRGRRVRRGAARGRRDPGAAIRPRHEAGGQAAGGVLMRPGIGEKAR